MFEKGRLAVGGSLGGRCCRFANPWCLGGLGETLRLGRVGYGEVGIDALGEIAEFKFGEELLKGGIVGFLYPEHLLAEGEGCIEDNGGELFAEQRLLGILLHETANLVVLDFLGMGDHVLDGAKLGDEFLGCLLPHPGNAGDIVGGVAPKAEQVDDLRWALYAIFFANLLFADDFKTFFARMRTIHPHAGTQKLTIIFVGRHHKNADFIGRKPPCQGADDVVGLEAGNLDDRDAIGLQNLLDVGHRKADSLGGFFALSLVGRVGLMAESSAFGVEGNAYVVGILLSEHFFQRIDEAHHSRCILSAAVDSRRLDEGIVSTVNQRISIKQKQFFHDKKEVFG